MKRLPSSMSKEQSFFGSCALMLIAVLAAATASPNTYNHPFWMVTGYFILSVVVQGIQSAFFEGQFELKNKLILGVMKLFTASLLLGTAICGFNDFFLLSIGVALGFFILGGINVWQGSFWVHEKLIERREVRRVMDRQAEEAAKRTLASIDKFMQTVEQRKQEEALFEDLTDFLGSADRK